MRFSKWLPCLLVMVGGAMLVSCNVKMPTTKEPPQEPPTVVSTQPESAVVEEPVSTAPNFLRAENTRWVDRDGKEVILRGCNLGNWLMLEMWMLDMSELRDQYEFESILEQRFGAAAKDEMMEIYRANWMTKRDFPLIRSFGFNTIRLPFNFRLLTAEAGPLELRPDAFKWLDWTVAMAKEYKLYVILDMHGLPGGQSRDHTTGHAGQNKLWTSPEHQERAIWLWQKIAEHYRDEPVVAAYDLINEPFGDYKTTNHIASLASLCDRLYQAIRSVDTNHVILFPGTHQGLDFYGRPDEHGWENMGFTEHYYPGLFGDEETVDAHAQFISRRLPSRESFLKRMNTPFLVGEFNVVFEKVGGAPLMRRYYDRFASYGWAATMWCYKLMKEGGGLGKDSWGMVANKEPLPPVSIKNSSRANIEALFRWFGTVPYDINTSLGAALTQKEPPPVELPELPVFPVEPPAQDALSGWQGTDIRGALSGGQNIYAGGTDIWDASDQFRFTWKPVLGDFDLGATLVSLEETHQYAKAGLMLRKDLEPDSPLLLFNVFPNGEIVLAWRSEKAAIMDQKIIGRSLFPVHLRMRRRGHMIDVAYSSDGKKWEKAHIRASDALVNNGMAGLAVLSHDNRVLTTASFKNVLLTR
jgi:endoglucanase